MENWEIFLDLGQERDEWIWGRRMSKKKTLKKKIPMEQERLTIVRRVPAHKWEVCLSIVRPTDLHLNRCFHFHESEAKETECGEERKASQESRSG